MRAPLAIVLVAACGRIGFESVGDPKLPPCTTSICECNADADCAAHGYCSAHDGAHTCECVAGYARGSTGACAWRGVVADPGFHDPAAWTLTAGATIDATTFTTGMVDPGAVTVSSFARASQQITMPRRSRAEPLVVELSSQAETDIEGQPFPPTIGVARAWHDFGSGASWVIERSCLGASEYAPESTPGAGAALPFGVALARAKAKQAFVDRVDIVPAMPGECLVPGAIPNADAEGEGGWTLVPATPTGNGTVARFVAGAGANGTRGVQLHVGNVCEAAGFTLPVAVPASEQLPSPALSFYFAPSVGANTEQSVYSIGPGVAVGDGVARTIVGCLTPDLRGQALTFGQTLRGPNGSCAAAADLTASFDDVKLVDLPACGTNPDITDPGFESQLAPLGLAFQPGVSSARLVVDPAQAHGGAVALRFASTVTCAGASFVTTVYPPPSSPAGGPALEFYYRASPRNAFDLVAYTDMTTTVIRDGAWHRGVGCFAPGFVGMPERVQFSFYSAGLCGMQVPEEFAFIDDLAVVNDPSCPQ